MSEALIVDAEVKSNVLRAVTVFSAQQLRALGPRSGGKLGLAVWVCLWGWSAGIWRVNIAGCVSVNPVGLWCVAARRTTWGGGSAALPPEERSTGACEPAYQYFLDQLSSPGCTCALLDSLGRPVTGKG